MPDRLPKNSCDTHLHVFGSAKSYPVSNPNALYQPPDNKVRDTATSIANTSGILRTIREGLERRL